MIRAIITEVATGMIRNKFRSGPQEAEGAQGTVGATTGAQAGSQQGPVRSTLSQDSSVERNPARCLPYRIVALLIDAIPVFIIAILAAALIQFVTGLNADVSSYFILLALFVVARVAYHTPLEHYYGFTPGKYVAGIRVYGPDGENPPSLQAAAIRNALRLVDGFYFYLVGFVVALFSGERKRIGDWAAGTKVLKINERSLLQKAADATKPNTAAGHEQQRSQPSPEPSTQQPEAVAHQQAIDRVLEEVVRIVDGHGEHAYVFRTGRAVLIFGSRGQHTQTVVFPAWGEGHATLSEDGDTVLLNGQEWISNVAEDGTSRYLQCLTAATFQTSEGQPTSHHVTTLAYLEHELLAYNERRTLEEVDNEVASLDPEDHRRLSSRLVYSPPQRQAEQPVGPQPVPESTDGQQTYLSLYAKDLTASARSGEMPPVIGREDQIKQVLRTLSRTTKNNPVLRGEAGVGKTAVAEGLARLAAGIEEGREIPKELSGMEIHELSLSAMEAGTAMRGIFEERLEGLLVEVKGRDDVILFVDELHRLMSAGSHSESASPAAQILKPALARGEMKLIGATTTDEYRQIESDAAMERRLQPVNVPPLTTDQTVQVLNQTRSRYEKDDVTLPDEALSAAAEWADRYIPGNLPDRAIDLVDSVAAAKRMEGGGVVTTADVSDIVEESTGIKPETSGADRARLSGLENELKDRVIGQDHAVSKVARTIRRQQTLGDERPASLLFLGSSGVGKTELAKALAYSLFGSDRRMVGLDMSEFQDEMSLSRLLGASRGYKESEEGGQLTEAVRRQPYSVILLDEIEKANGRILTILLQLLDEGRLTDGRGREVDFKNCVVIMTSNVGAERVLAGEEDPGVVTEDLLAAGFPPELLGRMDERVVFHPLSGDDLQQIVRGLVARVAERAKRKQGVELGVDDMLIAAIADEGYDPRFGARDLRNQVRHRVEDYFTNLITDGRVGGDSGIQRVELWYDAEDREQHWYVPEIPEEPE